VLIILSGLPATGKTTVAREWARHLAAVHVRIDSIEQAIRESTSGGLPVYDAGYNVGYAVAADNLKLGHTVIADSVNPLPLTRDAWVAVANRVQVPVLEIETLCSNAHEHRRRVETRTTDVSGLKLPSWEDVIACDYRSWDRNRLVIDTARTTVEQGVDRISSSLPRSTV
jgi:predicted kinase